MLGFFVSPGGTKRHGVCWVEREASPTDSVYVGTPLTAVSTGQESDALDPAAQPEALVQALRDGNSGNLDLRGADLRHQDLSGLDMSGADLSGAQLVGANLAGAKMSFCKLGGAHLGNANLDGAELLGSDLTEADLSECSGEKAGFGGTTLVGANLTTASLRGATFSQANLRRANFGGACLDGARLLECDLTGVEFTRSDLSHSDLQKSTVQDACFHDADLRDANLGGVSGYTRATWLGADTRDANFRGAHLMRRHIEDENYLHEFRTQSRTNAVIYSLWWLTSNCGRSFGRWAAFTGLLAVAFAVAYRFVAIDFGPNETLISPLYFSVVTLTTLGYGDALPVSVAAQVVVMAEVIIGYVALGGLLSVFATKMGRRAE